MEDNGLPAVAREALDGYLAVLDEALPGFAEGVYLTGSLALGDWIAEQSDLDVLVVSARPAEEKEFGLLRGVHEGRGRPYVDTVYVARDQLGMRPAEDFAGVPAAEDGVLEVNRYAVNPVLWGTLARHGITARGPEAAMLGVEPDSPWLREWNLGNLASYWTPLAGLAREQLARRDPDSTVKTQGAVWSATGPGRLHKTIATGRIISKTECTRYTAQLFPEYEDVLTRARASRLGDGSVEFTAADGLLLADMVDAVVADAARL